MRQIGRVQDWNDDKGFGFVISSGDGTRAFIHISAFQFGVVRPKNGDLIVYDQSLEKPGRYRASNARYAGQKIKTQSAPIKLPRKALGFSALIAVIVLAVFTVIPWIVAAAYGVLSGCSYLAYGLDKSSAERKSRRTPESTLHFLDLLGGWPGACIAQQQFHHKTIKISFQATFFGTVAINIIVVVWLISSDNLFNFF